MFAPCNTARFSQADIDKALQRELTIDNQDAKLKTLANWKTGIASGKIQSLNERKLQSEFLNKIFGDVLGYAYEKQRSMASNCPALPTSDCPPTGAV